mmetsp:Transcript_15574/g.33989  ORF Transcript_15574/g.33989 Transcript_15574/m.33989 type:complete len:200 (+) Transcript_15574:1593-2192(+)
MCVLLFITTKQRRPFIERAFQPFGVHRLSLVQPRRNFQQGVQDIVGFILLLLFLLLQQLLHQRFQAREHLNCRSHVTRVSQIAQTSRHGVSAIIVFNITRYRCVHFHVNQNRVRSKRFCLMFLRSRIIGGTLWLGQSSRCFGKFRRTRLIILFLISNVNLLYRINVCFHRFGCIIQGARNLRRRLGEWGGIGFALVLFV